MQSLSYQSTLSSQHLFIATSLEEKIDILFIYISSYQLKPNSIMSI